MSLLKILFRDSGRRPAAGATRRNSTRHRLLRSQLLTERLEYRLALSVSPGSGAEQAAFFSRFSADWFADVMPTASLPAAPLASVGGPGSAVVGEPSQPAVSTATPSILPGVSEWIVRCRPTRWLASDA